MKLTLPALTLSLLMSTALVAQAAGTKNTAKQADSPTNIGNTHPTGSSLRYKRPSKATRLKSTSTRVRDANPRGSSLKYRGPGRRSATSTKKTANARAKSTSSR